jgi:hypothetical protein
VTGPVAETPRLELVTLVLCDYALTAQDGKVSAIGIFSQINVSRLPAVHPRLFMVAMLDAEPGAHALTIGVVGPSGSQVLQRRPQLRMQVPAGAKSANIVADLKGMRIEELGRHTVELRAGQRLLGSAPFTVNLVWRQEKPASA